jgi:hypothetical protein
MPQVLLWNPWVVENRLAFDIVLPGWLAPIKRGGGTWLEQAVNLFGAKPSAVALLRPARFTYPGDYPDSDNWEDRWSCVTLVEVEVGSGAVNPPVVNCPPLR